MGWDEQEDTTIYKVVVNHEEQYSIWPEYREIPPGWKEAGKTGTKQECLVFIERIWQDTRPMTLRRMQEIKQQLQQSQEETD